MNLHERDDPPGLITALLYLAAICLLVFYLLLLIHDPRAVLAWLMP